MYFMYDVPTADGVSSRTLPNYLTFPPFQNPEK